MWYRFSKHFEQGDEIALIISHETVLKLWSMEMTTNADSNSHIYTLIPDLYTNFTSSLFFSRFQSQLMTSRNGANFEQTWMSVSTKKNSPMVLVLSLTTNISFILYWLLLQRLRQRFTSNNEHISKTVELNSQAFVGRD